MYHIKKIRVMKREIKFRGKAKDDGAWVHGDLTTGDTIHISASWYKDGECEWWGHECHEETIGQHTGLKDKNGVEIYEGDIFLLGGKNIIYTVVWHDTGLRGQNNGTSSYVGLEHWKGLIEIIGNIHDNPELLKDK